MKRIISVVLFLFVFMLIAACGSKEGANSPTEQATDDQETTEYVTDVVEGEFDPSDKSDWPNTLRLGAASVGGLYYTWAGGWASLVEDVVGVPTNVEVTGGPNHNIQLIEQGDIEIGMATVGPVYDAWYGEGDWTGGNELREFRVIFPMYPSVIHWWAFENSRINTISDFEGKTVGVGPAGGTPGTYLPLFLDALDINSELVRAGFSDMVSQQTDGLIDVIGWAGGIPAGAGMELDAQRNMSWIGFTEEEADKIIEELPYFSKMNIPAGTYESQEEDILGLQLYNVAIVDKGLPDSLVYQLVDSMMTNNERMVNVHVASLDTMPENIKYSEHALMHPGAIRWFEEHGYDLPDSVYPDNYPRN